MSVTVGERKKKKTAYSIDTESSTIQTFRQKSYTIVVIQSCFRTISRDVTKGIWECGIYGKLKLSFLPRFVVCHMISRFVFGKQR